MMRPFFLLSKFQYFTEVGNYQINGLKLTKVEGSILASKFTPETGENLFGVIPYRLGKVREKHPDLIVSLFYETDNESDILFSFMKINGNYLKRLQDKLDKEVNFSTSSGSVLNGFFISNNSDNMKWIYIPKFGLVIVATDLLIIENFINSSRVNEVID